MAVDTKKTEAPKGEESQTYTAVLYPCRYRGVAAAGAIAHPAKESDLRQS